MACDLPLLSSSMVTMRRTGLIGSVTCSLLELAAHHHEGHQAADARIGPAVPVAELHHDVTGPHHDLARVEDEYAFALEKDSVVHRLGLVDRRAETVLPAAHPDAVGAPARLVHRNVGRILAGVVARG